MKNKSVQVWSAFTIKDLCCKSLYTMRSHIFLITTHCKLVAKRSTRRTEIGTGTWSSMIHTLVIYVHNVLERIILGGQNECINVIHQGVESSTRQWCAQSKWSKFLSIHASTPTHKTTHQTPTPHTPTLHTHTHTPHTLFTATHVFQTRLLFGWNSHTFRETL